MATSTDNWSQPSLLPIHWPLVSLKMVWHFQPDWRKAMVGYDVIGMGEPDKLLAKGIEWVSDVHDPAQRAEMLHTLVDLAIGHLSPF